MCANDRVHYGRIRLFAHYTTSLTLLCRRISKHWTSKIPVMCILSRICIRLCQFSKLSFMQYMGCVHSALSIPLVMIVRIQKYSEVWPICHCLGLGHETISCIVCLSIFFPYPTKNFFTVPQAQEQTVSYYHPQTREVYLVYLERIFKIKFIYYVLHKFPYHLGMM